jgi:hypothetical protein
MSQSVIQQALQKINQGFDQKVSLQLPSMSLELSVHGEQAVGQIFDHFPLAQLTKSPSPTFQVKWMDSCDYGFTPQEWKEEIDLHFQVNGQEIQLQANYLAIREGSRILLIASYELGVGFLDFLKWLEERAVLK